MKKVLFILALSTGVMFSANAQISTASLQNVAKKASTVASAAGIDVNSVSTGILSKLTSSLALTNTQKPQVSTLVTTFLTQKSKILSLSTTDKVKYAAQLVGLSSNLQTKLNTVLTASQYAKFLNLKPATNTPSNVLSQLFY
jgi:hypothetical protein